MLVRREEMRARDRRAQALSRRIRRQAPGAAAAAGARLDLACGRLVPLPRPDARPQGDANRLLSPHRIFAAGSGVSAKPCSKSRCPLTPPRRRDAQAGYANGLGAMLAAKEGA